MRLLSVLCFVAAATSGFVVFGEKRDGLFASRDIGTDIPGFRYLFVDSNGIVTNTRGSRGTKVEIAGSPRSSDVAIQTAADIVSRMIKYMPSQIFHNLALNTGVGVFTAAEKLTVYPEYAQYANGNCGTRCDGSCSHTCTGDGRKYEDLAGLGGQRAAILDDNLLCTARDPYLHAQNILSHEFTHSIHLYALPDSVKHQITSAYNAAKQNAIWALNSYAMVDEKEFFAEAGSVFFALDKDSTSTGGMSNCGLTACRTEQEAREHLRQHDLDLYNILVYVFTNNRPSLSNGLTICPQGAVVG